MSSTKTINDYTAAITIDGANDYFLIEQSSAYKRINRNTILGIAGSPLGTTDSQSISNKTIGNTNTVTLKDSLFTLQDDADTTKQAMFQASGITTATTRTYTLPDRSSTLATLAGAQTFTGANSFTGSSWSGGTIDNAAITVDSIAGHTSATIVSVAGLSISAGVLNTNNSVVTANITDAAVTPAKLVAGTGSTWAYSSVVPTYVNFTLGNGTAVAYYRQIGKKVHYYGRVTLGSTSSVSGQMDVSLPVNASTNVQDFAPIGTTNIWDQSANAYYPGFAWKANGAQYLRVIFTSASGTYSSAVGTSSTVPMTWTTSDLFFWNVEYEVA